MYELENEQELKGKIATGTSILHAATIYYTDEVIQHLKYAKGPLENHLFEFVPEYRAKIG